MNDKESWRRNKIYKDMQEENANLNRENDRLNDELENLKEEKAEKSLAELADEKGMFVDISREKTGWDIEIVNKRTGALFESITGKTYAECEEKAIKYLEGLK